MFRPKPAEKPEPKETKASNDPKPQLSPFKDPAKAIEDIFRQFEVGSWDVKVIALNSLRRIVANHKELLIDRMSDIVQVIHILK